MPDKDRKEILITDIVERVVDAKLSDVTRRDQLRIIEYELEKIGPGRGIIYELEKYEPESDAKGVGPVTIRLGVSGYYRISFITRYSKLRVKLTGERCFSECEPILEGLPKVKGGGSVEGWFDAEEVLWREADLTGKDLILDDEGSIYLLAIRLTPSEPKKDTRDVRWPMAVFNGPPLDTRIYENPDELFEWMETIPQDSCVRVMVYDDTGGANCLHFTKVGTEYGGIEELAGGTWNKDAHRVVENLRRFHHWGTNPAEAMVKYAHRRGWEMFFYIRYRQWGDAYPVDGPRSSKFNLEHPEYRLVGPNGEPVMGLSIAYPEVRSYLCKLYVEIANFGADGICMGFNRGTPMVLYEPPMVEGFKREYGDDPRKLPDSDPRWLDYSARVVTTFMREVKKAVGPKCKLSAVVPGTEVQSRHHGMDVTTWVSEGLVDDLFIISHEYLKWGSHNDGGPENLHYEYFQNLAGRKKVRLWPMFYMWQSFEADPERYCAYLQKCLDLGADGCAFWDPLITDKRANIFDLGKMPRPLYQRQNRLLGKYELIKWDGYLWNRYTPIESW